MDLFLNLYMYVKLFKYMYKTRVRLHSFAPGQKHTNSTSSTYFAAATALRNGATAATIWTLNVEIFVLATFKPHIFLDGALWRLTDELDGQITDATPVKNYIY